MLLRPQRRLPQRVLPLLLLFLPRSALDLHPRNGGGLLLSPGVHHPGSLRLHGPGGRLADGHRRRGEQSESQSRVGHSDAAENTNRGQIVEHNGELEHFVQGELDAAGG